MFEKASRLKLRFETSIGMISAEDLWDLPLTSAKGPSLDAVAIKLHRGLKSGDDVSFVDKTRKSDETAQLRFDIVKRIIDVRLAENEAALAVRKNAETRQKILEIISEKEGESLKNMPLDELRAKLGEFSA